MSTAAAARLSGSGGRAARPAHHLRARLLRLKANNPLSHRGLGPLRVRLRLHPHLRLHLQMHLHLRLRTGVVNLSR